MSIADKLTIIAENQQKVYDAGYSKGQTEGGGDNHYNEFWDSFLANGVTGNYFFSGKGWTNDTFKPNKDLVIKNWVQRVFYNTGEIDVAARLAEKNLKIDMSACANCNYFATDSEITSLPEIDTQLITNLKYFIYNNSKLLRIEKIILKDDGTQNFSNTSFNNNAALTHVIFEGVIGQNDFNIKASTKLDKESLTSIINCLSATTSGLAITLSQTAVNNAFEGGSTGAEWLALVGTKSNWTINLS